MTDQVDELDIGYFQLLIERLTRSVPWVIAQGEPRPLLVAKQAGGVQSAIGELRLCHIHTDGELHVELPDYRHGNAARLVQYHPFEMSSTGSDNGFGDLLGRSHRAVAQTYESDYLEPAEDSIVVQIGIVPIDYTDSNIYAMMTAITATALRIERLHKDIRLPITEAISEAPVTQLPGIDQNPMESWETPV